MRTTRRIDRDRRMARLKGQYDLPWQAKPVTCQKCRGRGMIWRGLLHRNHIGIEIVGGPQVECPECEGTGTVNAPLF
jgi:DnaJ-class molecular chaperone